MKKKSDLAIGKFANKKRGREMARVGADGNKYPPTEFSQKYAAVLAPKGKLLSPKDVFGEEGCFDKGYLPPLTFTSYTRPVYSMGRQLAPKVT